MGKVIAFKFPEMFPRMTSNAAFSTGIRRCFATAVFDEFKIPVPWGYIAAKAWGNPKGLPILGIHGYRDNCGTFDRLAPLLPSNYHFVTYDLPGYGQSTSYPDGFYPNLLTYLADTRRVLKFLNWSKSAILGHSLGAATGLYYAATRPEDVTHLICIDPAKWITGHSEAAPNVLRKAVDQMMDIEGKKSKPHQYPVEEAISMSIAQSENSLTRDSAEILLQRGCQFVDDQKKLVRFNSDRKNQMIGMPMLDHDQTQAFANVVGSQVDTLILTAENGSIPKWAIKLDAFPLLDFLPLMKLSNKVVEVKVPGTHHVHLNNPEIVCEHITNFIGHGSHRVTDKAIDCQT